MKTYRVVWEIDIEAETPEEAAKAARSIQLNPNSIATCFTVEDGEWDSYVDLSYPENNYNWRDHDEAGM